MKKLRSIVSAGLVFAICLSVASCNGAGKGTEEPFEPPTVITEIEEPTETEISLMRSLIRRLMMHCSDITLTGLCMAERPSRAIRATA